MVLDSLKSLLEDAEKENRSAAEKDQLYKEIEKHNLINAFEELQNHPAHGVYQKAVAILDKYFEAEDEDNGVKPDA